MADESSRLSRRAFFRKLLDPETAQAAGSEAANLQDALGELRESIARLSW